MFLPRSVHHAFPSVHASLMEGRVILWKPVYSWNNFSHVASNFWGSVHSRCAGPSFCLELGVTVFFFQRLINGGWQLSVRSQCPSQLWGLPTLLFLLQETMGLVICPWKGGSQILNVCFTEHAVTLPSLLANCNCFAIMHCFSHALHVYFKWRRQILFIFMVMHVYSGVLSKKCN